MTNSGGDTGNSVPVVTGPDSTPPERPTRVSWLKRFTECLIILAITLVILEVLLRFLGLTHPVLYEADANAGYRLKPDQQVNYLGNTIVINHWGVRDSRSFATRAPETKRVLVLGDSVTWGGIREMQENLFTSVAEASLPHTEVINCGINGYSVTQMVKLYRHHLAPLDSDRVVVFAIPRDFTRPPVVQLTGSGIAFPQRVPQSAVLAAFSLARYFASERLGCTWLRAGPAAVPVAADIDKGDALTVNLDSVNELVQSVGSDRFQVVLLPTAPGTPDADRIGAIEEQLRKRDIPVRNLAGQISIGSGFYVDGVHLTAEGHEQVGKALATILSADG